MHARIIQETQIILTQMNPDDTNNEVLKIATCDTLSKQVPGSRFQKGQGVCCIAP